MIQSFIEKFEENRSTVRKLLSEKHPGGYEDIVKIVCSAVGEEDDYASPDPNRVHRIDDGDYQGTLVFIIGAYGYQPSQYWAVKISYGSCSACDTFQSICYSEYSDIPTEAQVNDYMTLAIHVLQGLKEV